MQRFANTVAIMPARGGSKRIPDKNVRPVCGRPMLSWPLQQLLQILPPEAILVSTDSAAIRAAAADCGITSPYRRPDSLADDFTPTLPVIAHALEWYEQHVKPMDWVLFVYPTALLVRHEDISSAWDTLQADPDLMAIFSAVAYRHPIQRAFSLNAAGRVEMFHPEHCNTRSQDLVPAWHDAGQFYLCRAHAIRQGLPLIGPNSTISVLPHFRAVDIDTPDDLVLAEVLLGAQQNGSLPR